MKQIMYALLLMLCYMPVVASAADYCTDPEKYTVDRRCYVTNEQKKEKPYSAVVTFINKNGYTSCSGTIVKRQGLKSDSSGYFLYTAKHCTDYNHDNLPDDALRIKLPDNREFDALLLKYGDSASEDSAQTSDWAIYSIVSNDSELENSFVKLNTSFMRGKHNTRVIGYGHLKIMSDEDIEKFKDEYVQFLINLNWGERDDNGNLILSQDSGFYPDGGMRGAYVMMFANKNKFNDDELKVSYCTSFRDASFSDCQGWSGNSGGGAFDDDGDLMWIITLGNYTIGSDEHAGITGGINIGPFGKMPGEHKK